jgi:hypothetical protein
MFVKSEQTPLNTRIDHRARKQSLSTLGASFLSATLTSGNFLQRHVWRVMLSLHLRLSIGDDTILLLDCRQGHTTIDSDDDHATLSCHRTPCGWVSRPEHIKKIIAREGPRAVELYCAFKVPMLIPSPLRVWTSVSNVHNVHVRFLIWPISAPIWTNMDTSFPGAFAGNSHFNEAHCKFWLASRFSLFKERRMRNMTQEPI